MPTVSGSAKANTIWLAAESSSCRTAPSADGHVVRVPRASRRRARAGEIGGEALPFGVHARVARENAHDVVLAAAQTTCAWGSSAGAGGSARLERGNSRSRSRVTGEQTAAARTSNARPASGGRLLSASAPALSIAATIGDLPRRRSDVRSRVPARRTSRASPCRRGQRRPRDLPQRAQRRTVVETRCRSRAGPREHRGTPPVAGRGGSPRRRPGAGWRPSLARGRVRPDVLRLNPPGKRRSALRPAPRRRRGGGRPRTAPGPRRRRRQHAHGRPQRRTRTPRGAAQALPVAGSRGRAAGARGFGVP
jgi:hypothetical protein